jgi:hypothetical protein
MKSRKEEQMRIAELASEAAGKIPQLLGLLEAGHKIDRSSSLAKRFSEFIGELDRALAGKKPKPLDEPAGPDFDHYARLSIWQINEAVALAVGVSPDLVPPEDHGERLARLSEYAHSAVTAGDLPQRVSPPHFLQWMDRWGYAVDERLRAAVQRNIDRYRSTTDVPLPVGKEGKTSPQYLHTTQRLLVYFAYKAGEIGIESDTKPKIERAHAISISEDMERVGLGMNFDTVKDHLGAAVQQTWDSHLKRFNSNGIKKRSN